MKNNKGISLIVLVITIIVIIILAGSVILSLANNNPISQATEATYKSTIDSYNSELNMAIASKYAQDSTFNPANFYASPWDGGATTADTVKQFITSMTSTDGSKYAIVQGKLVYVGTDASEKQWAKSVGVTDDLLLWLDGADFKNSPQTTVWADKSGDGNNATAYSFAYTTTSGSDGAGAVAFDGTSDYAVVNYNFPETLTIETWSNAISIDGRMMWSFDGSNQQYGPDVYPSSNRLSLNINDGANNPFTNLTTYPSVNAWHHYVVVFDKVGNIGKLYIDGAFVGTAAYRNPTGPKLFIGKYDNYDGFYWYGTIKTIKVYNRVLSATEILQKYNATK